MQSQIQKVWLFSLIYSIIVIMDKPDYINHFNDRRNNKQQKVEKIFDFIEQTVNTNNQISNLRIEILLKKELCINCNHQTIRNYRNRLESLGKIPIRKIKYNSLNHEDKISVYDTVYFVEAVGTNLCKIGFASELRTRIKDLMWSNACTLQILGYIENSSPTAETELHAKFNAINHHGDWFYMTKELKEFIDCNANKNNITLITQQSQQLKKSTSPSGISIFQNSI